MKAMNRFKVTISLPLYMETESQGLADREATKMVNRIFNECDLLAKVESVTRLGNFVTTQDLKDIDLSEDEYSPENTINSK